MTDFKVAPDMLTFGGAFYPKGYMFIMFPLEKDAQQVAAALKKWSDKPEVMHLSPATVEVLADLASFFENHPQTLNRFLKMRKSS